VKVKTEVLRASAHQLRVCAGQLAIAAECHRVASRWDLAECSLLALIGPGHEARAGLLQRRLEKASTVLSNTAHTLAEAARTYDAGNAEAARLLSPEVEA
jgi:hypothetical protein